ARPAWQIQDLHPSGACGNAAAASSGKGEATLVFAVKRLVEVLEDVERMPLDNLGTEPGW
ncbi:MAG: creatininase family protein, partial [Boseongicola sp.]|nr:creatininase family protein [Boseongicola sp.]